MSGPKKGVNVTHNSGSDGFKETRWEKKDDNDKGTRTSYDWKPSGGGWNRGASHSTDQNKAKGSPGRHPK